MKYAGKGENELNKEKNYYSRRDECARFQVIVMERKKEIILFDTETTGLTKSDKVVQICAIKLRPENGNYKVAEQMNIYINPEMPMPKEAEAVHGLSNEFLNGFPNAKGRREEITGFFGDITQKVIGGYNVGFDIKMMKRLYETEYGLAFDPGDVIDGLVMARELFTRDMIRKALINQVPLEEQEDLKEHAMRLGYVTKFLGITADGKLHDASTDILVTGNAMWQMLSLHTSNMDGQYPDPKKLRLQLTFMKRVKFGGKHGDFIFLYVRAYRNGIMEKAKFHYDVYNRKYVEDDGDLMKDGDMYTLTIQADQYAGGKITDLKVEENN